MRRGLGFVVMLVVFCFISRSGYASMSSISGWERKLVYYDSARGYAATVEGIDINGEVGHPVLVGYPTADCKPGGHWSSNQEVASGTLPPGLVLNGDGSITGIPTERGHWIVMMNESNIQCNGESYYDFAQQLRFHITGTGKVIE